MRVLVADTIAADGIAYLRDRDVQVDELPKPSRETLYARLPEYDGLITRSGTAVTAELLNHAPRLRIVGRAGVGIDNIDVEACSRRGGVGSGDLRHGALPQDGRSRRARQGRRAGGRRSPLVQHARVIVTPHLGANSTEAQVNVAVDVARQLVAFRDGEMVEHAVNIPVGDPAAVAEVAGAVEADFARLIRLA